MKKAESEATSSGKQILEMSQKLIDEKQIFVGGCWDFINSVYNRSGFTADKRETVFKSKQKGPYLTDPDLIRPGDWLYFINHSYRDIEHSAIFIAWTSKSKKEAMMVNYVGEKKKKPAFYKKFLLDEVYNIIRPRE